MTQEEIKEIERVFQKPISEVEELDIPTYIRNREFEDEMKLCEHLDRLAEEYENERFAERAELDAQREKAN